MWAWLNGGRGQTRRFPAAKVRRAPNFGQTFPAPPPARFRSWSRCRFPARHAPPRLTPPPCTPRIASPRYGLGARGRYRAKRDRYRGWEGAGIAGRGFGCAARYRLRSF